MKANPGKAAFVDQNAAARVTGVLMQQMTGTQVLFVPYRGAGPAMQVNARAAGGPDGVQAAVALPQVRGGAVKILANLSPARSSVIPTVPTSEESGIPGLYALGLVRPVRAEGHAEGSGGAPERCHGAGASPIRRSRTRFADLGLDMASREQQSPRRPRGLPQGGSREVVGRSSAPPESGLSKFATVLVLVVAGCATVATYRGQRLDELYGKSRSGSLRPVLRSRVRRRISSATSSRSSTAAAWSATAATTPPAS